MLKELVVVHCAAYESSRTLPALLPPLFFSCQVGAEYIGYLTAIVPATAGVLQIPFTFMGRVRHGREVRGEGTAPRVWSGGRGVLFLRAWPFVAKALSVVNVAIEYHQPTTEILCAFFVQVAMVLGDLAMLVLALVCFSTEMQITVGGVVV